MQTFMDAWGRKVWRLLAAALLGGSGLLVAACNTVEGAGRDVQAVGRGVEGGAQEVRDDVFY